MRIGHGYDVHKFAENRKLILGGTEIPYEFGLLGHSDGTKAQTASLCSKRFAEFLTKTATKSAILILR